MFAYIFSQFYIYGEEIITLGLRALGVLIYFSWHFAVGLELYEYLPKRIYLSKTLFIINGIALILSMLILFVVFDGHFSSNDALGLLWVLYIMFAILQFFLFLGKVLKTIEIQKKAVFGDYFLYFIMLVIWPIGIWWIQPRLNGVVEKYDETTTDVDS